MPINWKLQDLLKERGGNNASEISRIVLDQTGYQLSVATPTEKKSGFCCVLSRSTRVFIELDKV